MPTNGIALEASARSTDEFDALHEPSQSDRDATAAWQALMDDAGALVLVLDRDGRVHLANASAELIFADEAGTIGGRALRDYLPSATVEELIQFVTRVTDGGEVILLRSVLRGYWLSLTLRPFTADDRGRPRVLVTGRLGHTAEAPNGTAWRESKAVDRGTLATLTPREFDVLRLVALGLSTADVAKELYRSVKTVEGHRVSLGNKLGVSNRVELARIALRRGIVTPEQRAAN